MSSLLISSVINIPVPRSAVYAGEEVAVKFFNDWNNMILRTVPKEKLLIYNVKDGWEPLAEFLNMDVPDEAFPDINDGITITLIVMGGYYILVLVIPTLILFCLWRKSSKFRNVLQRMFGLTCGPFAILVRKCRKSQKRFQNNNNMKNNNNINTNGKNFDYVQYSNVEPKV